MYLSVSTNCFIVILAGLCLGCAAPGVEYWQTAWFALAPLLFFIAADRGIINSVCYGFLFGIAYNAVYLHWYLNLAPLDWLGFANWQSQLLSVAALIITAGHQALIISLFAFVYCLFLRILGFFGWKWLSDGRITGLLNLLIVPFLWVLITNRIGNAHDFTGVPWSMLEYTQYKQLQLIQVADLIGGIGICFLIVLVNTLLAQIAYYLFFENSRELSIFTTLKNTAGANWPAGALSLALIAFVLFYGQASLANIDEQGSENVSIVQPNINIEMEKSKSCFTVDQLLALQLQLSSQCPPGLCIWTESALPARLCNNPNLQKYLQGFAQEKNLSLILGTIDQDSNGNVYNSAWAVSSSGQISKNIYHKRYLVPFGEYTPVWVRNWPDWILALTNTPAGGGYQSGQDAEVLQLDNVLIAPLICFEVISPELAAASVRAGGQLLVNINDLAWFHRSIIGDQMIACGVLRAIENRRDLVFAANTGPSAIISTYGNIKSLVGQNKACNLINKINYSSKLTAFTSWYTF